VDLAFRVGGYVEQIGTGRDGAGRLRELEEGDVVEAGAVLARLRRTEYQSRESYSRAVAADANATLGALQAQLSEAAASLQQATRDYERATSLLAERAMTQADFDAVEARRDSAAARRENVLAQITAQKARIAGAESQHQDSALSLSDTAITAPFPGVVIAKKIARGSLVTAGAPAFVIADTRVAKVTFGVPDLSLGRFRMGDTLPVTAEAVPNREFYGRISSIGGAADPASRLFAVEISIPNAARTLRVGMVTTVVAPGVSDPSPRPSIPLSAVVKSQVAPGGYGVYAVDGRDGDERVRLVPVSLGPVRGNEVVITAGLNPGQRVVAAGGLQLADGERVKQIP
jgi:RND family efflux transporter MFP subunit